MIGHWFTRISFAVGTLIYVFPVCAQDDAPPVTAKAEALDFSSAFALLRELGLPSVEGAEWGQFSGEQRQEDHDIVYTLERVGITLQGGWWRHSVGGEDAGDLVSNWGTSASDRVSLSNGSPQEEGQEESDLPVGSWTPSDLTIDVEHMIERLASFSLVAPAESDRDPFEYRDNDDFLGRVVLFAASLDEAGEAGLASRLAESVFNCVAPEFAEKIIDHAIDLMVKPQFEAAGENFHEDGEWGAYRTAVADLVERYPRGWQGVGGAEILIERITERLENSPESPVPPTGAKVSPDALAAVTKLLDPLPKSDDTGDEAVIALIRERYEGYKEGVDYEITPELIAQFKRMGQQGGMAGSTVRPGWVLGGGEDSGGEGDAPVKALQALGLDGAAALALVLGDTTLTHYPRGAVSPTSRSRRSYSHGGESPSPEEAYKTLDRPMSRGEIAQIMLMSTIPLPTEGGSVDEMESAEVQDLVLGWVREQRGRSPVEMAKSILDVVEDDEALIRATIEFIIDAEDPEGYANFEAVVLGEEDPERLQSFSDGVESYLSSRGADGQAFLTAYSEKLRSAFGGEEGTEDRSSDHSHAFYQLNEYDGVEGYVRFLETKIGSVSISDIIATVLSGETEVQEGGRLIISTIRELDEDKATAALIEVLAAAAAADSDEQRELIEGFLGVVLQFVQRMPYEQRRVVREGAREAMDTLLQYQWSTVTFRSWAPKISFVTGFLDEGLAMQDLSEIGEVYALMPLMGEGFWELLMARVAARKAGEAPPAFPSIDNVSDERRTEILTEIAGVEGRAIVDLYEALGTDEKLALSEDLADPDLRPASLATADWLIASVIPAFDDPLTQQLAEVVGMVRGAEVDSAWLEAAINSLLTAEFDAPAASLSLMRTGEAFGMVVNIQPFDGAGGKTDSIVNYSRDDLESTDAERLLAISFYTEDSYEQAEWPGDEEDQATLLEQFKALFEIDQAVPLQLQFRVIKSSAIDLFEESEY